MNKYFNNIIDLFKNPWKVGLYEKSEKTTYEIILESIEKLYLGYLK